MLLVDQVELAGVQWDRQELGAVYTPPTLADWLAELIRSCHPGPVGSVLDPSCGAGALLAAAASHLHCRLIGIEISAPAAAVSAARLAGQSADIRTADALFVTRNDLPHVDAVVMNPPWGASIASSRAQLRAAGFRVAEGQYDSWDLFVEWTLRVLDPGTVVAAVLPDAVFSIEHRRIRRLLLEDARLEVVARLGEGWFDGVSRGVAVLVWTVGQQAARPVRVVRIDREAQARVSAGLTTLSQEAERVEHRVDSAHWAAQPDSSFAVTAHVDDSRRIRELEKAGGDWSSWFHVGRGVEIGASGRLSLCASCGQHRAFTSRTVCEICGGTLTQTSAVSTAPIGPGWVPLIVGRDVRRFEAVPSRWLRQGLRGVDYKNAMVHASARLLVRKTGLGLVAAVDRSGAYTNQVVFHYVPRMGTPVWALDYVQGVLSSRVLLALHLARTGETEWRSHPYVTPRYLATLPVPVPNGESHRHEAVAAAARAVVSAGPEDRSKAEEHLDGLVAGLFGLDAAGCAWVDAVLQRTQDIGAFAHLRGGIGLRAHGA